MHSGFTGLGDASFSNYWMPSLPNQICLSERWNRVWFLLISAMPSWWKEISSGSADSQLGSQLPCAGSCLWLSVTSKVMEGTWGVHEDVKALLWGDVKKQKRDADVTEKFRKYNRRAGNSTVGWHRAYMNPEFPSTCVARFGISGSQIFPPGKAQGMRISSSVFVQTQPLLSSLCVAPKTIFSEACTAQHLLFYFLLTWKRQAFTEQFQVVICVLCIYYLSQDVWDL